MRKCPNCNRELDIESFRASRSRKLLKRCRPCSGNKGVLESPQKAVSPPSKRNRNYTSPTKASLGRSINRQAPARPPPSLQIPAPPPAPAFLLRGQYSQDDDETAAAREEQNNIRRRHRLADRHHEERSPTPSLNTLMSRARAPLESPISRSPAPSPVPRSAMVLPAIFGSLAPSPVPRSTTVSPVLSQPSAPDPVDERLRPTPPSRTPNLPVSVPDPVDECPRLTSPSRNPNLPVSEEEWQMLQSFHEELDKDIPEECSVCNERWFNMGISNGICIRCRRRDKNKAEDEPELFSKENLMDPGSIPEHLPALTQVEEMLIARVHVFIEVRQVRGQQYKYTGHVINFLQDVEAFV